MGWNDHGEIITLRCEECDCVDERWVWDDEDLGCCEECGSPLVHNVLNDDEDELNPDSLSAMLARHQDR